MKNRFGRNCCRWTGFIWSLLVTQVVTYIRTKPALMLLLFIPYKFLVRMMIKFRINERERKRGRHYKTAAIKSLSFFLSIKAYMKRYDVAYF